MKRSRFRLNYTRAKQLGLALLLGISLATTGALYHTVEHLAGKLDRVLQAYAEDRDVMEQLDSAVANARATFQRYRERTRIDPQDVLQPLHRLQQIADQLPLGGDRDTASKPLRDAIRTTRHAFNDYVSVSALRDERHADSLELERVLGGLSQVRLALRKLIAAVLPGQLPLVRDRARAASNLVQIAEANVREYADNDPIQIAAPLALVARARRVLGWLDRRQGAEEYRTELHALAGVLSRYAAVMHGYHDAERAEGEGVETVLRYSDEADELGNTLHLAAFDLSARVGSSLERARLEAREEANRTRLYALFAAIATGVAVFLVSVRLGARLSADILRVISGTERLARGEFGVRLEEDSKDDLGRLAIAFNRMADDLEARDRDLARLLGAVEQAPDGIAVLDLEGSILYANHKFYRMAGCEPGHCGELDLERLYPEADGVSLWRKLLHRAREGGAWRGRIRALRLDGSGYEEFCTVAPVLADDGSVANVVALKRDVTREVQMEERVRESQKLQALGTMAGGIAHDFNNLMSPIMGYAGMMLARTPEELPDHRRLQRIVEAASEASALVKQILAFSRPGHEARGPLLLSSLVKEVLKLFQVSLPPNVKVEVRLPDSLPPVLADPSQVHQVLMNLLTNAKHAMGRRAGVLEVSLREFSAGDPVLAGLPGMGTGRWVRLSVHDEGCGMAPEVQERIFDPFYSTKGLGEGTGMGLSVVRGIVEAHGGAITVDSAVERGSTFRVYLPVADTKDQRDAAATEAAAEPAAGSERILILEDQAEICEALCTATEFLGYRVVGRDGVDSALRELAVPGDPVDVLVLDERWVGGNARALLAQVRQQAPDLGILVCCRYDDEQTRDAMRAAGADDIATKPVSPEEIGRGVRRIVAARGQ